MTRRCAYAVALVTCFTMTAFAEEAIDQIEPNAEQPAQPDGDAGSTEVSEDEGGAFSASEDEEQVGDNQPPSVAVDDEVPSEELVAPEEPDDVQSESDGASEPEDRPLVLTAALLEIRPRLVDCFTDESAAIDTVLFLRASGGTLSPLRTVPSIPDREVRRCIGRLLRSTPYIQSSDEVLHLRLSLTEGGERASLDPQFVRALRSYRSRYAAGVARVRS